MNKTGIEWCDYTWNPVTGCLHGCEYCYARVIANRFKASLEKFADRVISSQTDDFICYEGEYHVPFPIGFKPTFYKERLCEPQKLKKPSNIFVCSMADLFGNWVPDRWIQEVFRACETAPQHRYLFLTKNPGRYMAMWDTLPTGDNYWYGSTVTSEGWCIFHGAKKFNSFVSIEPIHEALPGLITEYSLINWVIIGAETGNRKDKIIPKREWIESIVEECRTAGIPVFMKNSLAGIWSEELIQEYPW